MTDVLPAVDLAAILSLVDLEPLARERMDAAAFDYVAGGSWGEVTLAENVAAWRRHRFMPRVLTGVRSPDVGGTFLGRRFALPVAMAPMAAQALAHPDGELEAARGAVAAGIPFCLSTSSSRTLEEVAEVAPDAERWFQLYLIEGLAYSRTLVERAASNGYRALVLTVDFPVPGYRIRDRRSGWRMPAMPHIDGAARGRELRYGGLEQQHAIGLDWDVVDEIRGWSEMPLVLKGVLSPADARMAVEAGAAAIVVSNHGARQLDRSITTADALAGVVDAVAGACEVWVDGGIRSGLDILVACAIGASGVLIGRPLYWALAVGGAAGIARATMILREELELALTVLGAQSLRDLDRTYLA